MASSSAPRAEVQPAWIRVVDWVKQTGMSRSETYRLMYGGQIRAVKIGKSWFIRADEITEFFERCNEAA